MLSVRFAILTLLSAFIGTGQMCAAETQTRTLQALSVDVDAAYHVRDLHLNRGGVQLYLTDGTLAFLRPVNGRIIGALFTIDGNESGDGEILLLPPERAERASIASFIQSPNLSEHLRAAVFLFADATASEIEREIGLAGFTRIVPDELAPVKERYAPVVSDLERGMELRLLESLLDAHRPENGFFFAALFPRTLAPFTLFYDPAAVEPVTVGRSASAHDFKLWTSFRPARMPPAQIPPSPFSNYRIDTEIGSDLALRSAAGFDIRVGPEAGQVLRFDLSDRLTVNSAEIDGIPAEVVQRPVLLQEQARVGGAFLLVASRPLEPGVHKVQVRYAGQVIRKTAEGGYFVDDRTTWYPYNLGFASTFDLTFRCPDALELAATGERTAESKSNGIRTVRYQALEARPYAGFNLGRYVRTAHVGEPPYRVEVFRPASLTGPAVDIGTEAEQILDFYTRRWKVVPNRNISITPISGFFGQGFPGLVYLSETAYIPEQDRPPALRSPRFDRFLSQILLPHEVAHQWWGNRMTVATYRSGWMAEAFANHSAIEYVAHTLGSEAARGVLRELRSDLLLPRSDHDSRTLESTGPLNWGQRLLNTDTPAAWQAIVYGKGTWVLRMLRKRMGDAAFLELERVLLESERQPITEDAFRAAAARLSKASENAEGAKDPELLQFFETWISNSGVPRLGLRREGGDWVLSMEEVDESFTADIPLACRRATGARITYMARVGAGSNVLPRAARQFSACSLPSNDDFLYRN